MKKKLYAVTIFGCLLTLISSSVLAASKDNYSDTTPSYSSTTMCWQDDAIFSPQGRQKVLSYSEQFQKDYPWMYAGTRHSAANSFVIIDRAEKDNKVSAKQANELKKELIAFYKNQQQDENTCHESNHHSDFSIRRNLCEIAQKTGVSIDTLYDIFYFNSTDCYYR